MNPTSPHVEEKLLEYTYGELSEGDSKTVEAHLRACATCADSLRAMKQVRRTMAQLPMVAPPKAGLDSLLSYAESAAKASRAKPARRSPWLRWVMPLASLAALSVVLVVSSKVARQTEGPIASNRDEARGDWASARPPSAKKSAAPAGETEATASKIVAVPQEPEARKKPAALEKHAAAPTTPAEENEASPSDGSGGSRPLDDKAPAKKPAERASVADQLPKEAQAPNQWASPPASWKKDGQPELNRAAGDGERARKAKVAMAPPPERSAPREGQDFDGRQGGVMNGMAGNGPGGAAGAARPAEKQPGRAQAAGERAMAGEAKARPSALVGRSPASPSGPARDDREREVAQLRQVLARGAQGEERARLLRRLCEALDELGREREADSACDAVIREFPRSDEARSALQRSNARAVQPPR